jgi:hypothetical protein
MWSKEWKNIWVFRMNEEKLTLLPTGTEVLKFAELRK